MAARKPRAKKKQAWYQTINWRRWGWLAFKLGLVLFAGLLVTGIVNRATWAALQAQSCNCDKEE